MCAVYTAYMALPHLSPILFFFSFSCLLLAHRRWLFTFYIQFSVICTDSFSVFVTKHITAWRWWITWPLFGVKVSLYCPYTRAYHLRISFQAKISMIVSQFIEKRNVFIIFKLIFKPMRLDSEILFTWFGWDRYEWMFSFSLSLSLSLSFFSFSFLFLVDMCWKLNEWNLYSFNNVGHIVSFFPPFSVSAFIEIVLECSLAHFVAILFMLIVYFHVTFRLKALDTRLWCARMIQIDIHTQWNYIW